MKVDSDFEDSDLYDNDFANRFIKIAADVRDYIDNECIGTLEDLVNKYKK